MIIPGNAELKGTFLETGPPAFPRGNGSGKGGGAELGTWLAGAASPGLGLWVFPLGGVFFPHSPCLLTPHPGSSRIPAQIRELGLGQRVPSRKRLCHQQPDGKYGLNR